MKLLDFSIILCAISLATLSCETNSHGDSSDMPICTMEYKTISVKVTNADGTPAKLDSVIIKNAESGKAIAPELNADLQLIYQQMGYYPVVSDNRRKELHGTPVEYTFAGYANGKIVANTTLNIGADDCHILLLDGNAEIVLQDN